MPRLGLADSELKRRDRRIRWSPNPRRTWWRPSVATRAGDAVVEAARRRDLGHQVRSQVVAHEKALTAFRLMPTSRYPFSRPSLTHAASDAFK